MLKKRRKKPGPPPMWPKVARLNIKLGADDLPRWRAAAERAGEGVSEYVRNAVDQRMEREP